MGLRMVITASAGVSRLFIDDGPVLKTTFDASFSVSQCPGLVELKPLDHDFGTYGHHRNSFVG